MSGRRSAEFFQITRLYGSREVISCVACELRVVTLAALSARLETNMRREMWRSYTANTLWNIARGLAAATNCKYDAPSYTSLMDERPREERTGAQIVDDVLSMLERRVGLDGSV